PAPAGTLGLAPQHERALALEHRPAAFGQRQRAVAFVVHGEQALRQQLAQHAAPGFFGQVGAHAEHAQPVVAVLADAPADLAAQDIDDVAGAEALPALLPEPVDRRKHFLRRHRAVPGLRRLQAGIAIAAGLYGLAEIRQQALAPAFHGFAQAQHGVELGTQAAAKRVVAG